VMSNHYHLVVTDPHGNISDFEQYLNSLLARSINHLRGRSGSVWDPEPYNGVELLDEEAVVERLAYVHANPVIARLVSRARHWEGATSLGWAYGSPRVIERPNVFFSQSMPEQATLELVRPAVFMHLGDETLERSIGERVRHAEEVSAEIGPAMGMRRVVLQHWNDSPPKREHRARIRPRVAAACSQTRAMALRVYRSWLDHYADALRRFRGGDRNTVFPAGTYWMYVRLGCLAGPP
jgi:putative transposase